MKLSEFILANVEPILLKWDTSARLIQPVRHGAVAGALRRHAEWLLLASAAELATPEVQPSPGNDASEAAGSEAAASLHPSFTIEQIAAAYHSLRSAVLELWGSQTRISVADAATELVRFNACLDRALAAAIARHALMVRQAQNLFLGVLGHDVRNPLGAINMAAHFLLQTIANEGKFAQAAANVLDGTDHVKAIVNDLVDVTRAYLGNGIPVYPQDADMAMLCRQAIERMQALHPDCVIRFEATGNVQGCWDRTRIGQLFCHLISQALHHNETCTPITITVCADRDKNSDDIVATVCCADFVLPPKELAQLFDPMQRYATEIVPDGSPPASLVLGFYLAREIALAHHGALDASATADAGTSFTLRLPRRQSVSNKRTK